MAEIKEREKLFATLNTGANIPLLGFGTASGNASNEEVKAAAKAAIQAGYRHFDTTSCYGSERPLGDALREAFEAGIVRREEVFVTSKLWCSDNYPDGVIPALRKSLSALGLQYLDLYLMHLPLTTKEDASFSSLKEDDFLSFNLKATWQAMEKCVDLGLTEAIGVSNFSSKKVEDVLTYARIPPAVNQVEMHPKWRQRRLREYCSKANIHVSAWSPLGAFRSSWGSIEVLKNHVINEIASMHGKTPAQVALRWGVEQNVSVLPKSYDKGRLVENMQIFDWHLTKEDNDKINKIEEKKIGRLEYLCNSSTSPYKTVEELWDGEM